MKKFFNDHVILFLVLALICAAAALWFGVTAWKKNKDQEDKLVNLATSLEPLVEAAAEQADHTNAEGNTVS